MGTHSEKVGIDLGILVHVNIDEQTLECLGHLHSLTAFAIDSEHIRRELSQSEIQCFADIITRSPGLESLDLRANWRSKFKLKDILSRLPHTEGFVNCDLKHLNLIGVYPPSEHADTKTIPFLESLAIQSWGASQALEVVEMWRTFCELGSRLTSVDVDHLNLNLCEYLISDSASNLLKSLRLNLPYRGSRKGDFSYIGDYNLSQKFWQQVIPRILCYLHNFKMRFQEIKYYGLKFPLPYQLEAFEWDSDISRWTIQNLAPHVHRMGPSELRNMEIMVAVDSQDYASATDAVKIFERIRCNNFADLSVELLLMTKSYNSSNFREQMIDNESELKKMLNGRVLKADGKPAPFLNLEIKSLCCLMIERLLKVVFIILT